ncbi:(2Fe-2S)-binding protein, partial [Pseudomonas sp. BGM005]|nr:(2Fe-2S)-binding protein [Pseudomonas sp. BG5]
PGTVVTVDGAEVTTTQSLYSEAELAHIFDEKWDYLEEQRSSRQQEILDEEASRAEVLPAAEILEALKGWWEPLLKKSRTIRL